MESHVEESVGDSSSSELGTKEILLPLQRIWNCAFLISCVFGVSMDSLFLYVPIINQDTKCLSLDRKLKIVAFTLRSCSDFYYLLDLILFQIPTAMRFYRTTLMFRRTLNDNFLTFRRTLNEVLKQIPEAIWQSHTLIDIFAVLPIPQAVIISKLRFSNSRKFLNFLVLFQYIPRVLRIYQLLEELEKTPNRRLKILITGVSKFWVKGVCMIFLFILASQVFGALWYFFSYQREIDCWQYACGRQNGCELSTFDCDGDGDDHTLKNVTFLNNLCPISPANATLFDFGIFLEVLQSGMLGSRDFSQKFWRCFWWGLRNLSSFGQNLQTGSYAWENIFAVFICLTGMLLVLIYLSAILQLAMTRSKENKKLRKMMAKRNPEIATWLDENDLHLDLKEKIMTNIRELKPNEDVNIVNLHSILRLDHVRDIKHHLCLRTLKRVPVLQDLEEKQLEGICVYLKPVIYNENHCIIQQQRPLDKMLIITQGTVRTYKNPCSDGSGSSSSNAHNRLGKGDFYGEEILECALQSNFDDLPFSTRSVVCSTKVEGFTLMATALRNIEPILQASSS